MSTWDPPVLRVTWTASEDGVLACCDQWPAWKWSGPGVDRQSAQKSLLGHRSRHTQVVHEGLFGLEVASAGKRR